jgi:hypothetical protein
MEPTDPQWGHLPEEESHVYVDEPDQPELPLDNHANEILDVAYQFQTLAYDVDAIETLETPTKLQSIEIARNILNNMKIQIEEQELEQHLDSLPEAERIETLDGLLLVGDIYKDYLAYGLLFGKDILDFPFIQDGNMSIEALAWLATLYSEKEMKKLNQMLAAQAVMKQAERIPNAARMQAATQTSKQLIGRLENGLERLFETLIERSASRGSDETNHLALENQAISKGNQMKAPPAAGEEKAESKQSNPQEQMRRQEQMRQLQSMIQARRVQRQQRRQQIIANQRRAQQQRQSQQQQKTAREVHHTEQGQHDMQGNTLDKNTAFSGMIPPDQLNKIQQTFKAVQNQMVINNINQNAKQNATRQQQNPQKNQQQKTNQKPIDPVKEKATDKLGAKPKNHQDRFR